MLQDIRFALRSLLHQKLVTLMVVSCLALVVAGNTSVFSVVRSYLLKPLPYSDVEQLAFTWETRKAIAGAQGAVSSRTLEEFRKSQRSFEQLEATRTGFANLTGDGRPEQLQVEEATPGLLPMVGAKAAVGRVFTADEALPGQADVVVLTHRLWEDRFGARPDIVGQTIELDRQRAEVIGVLSEDFEWINWDVDAWRPLVVDPAAAEYVQRDLDQIIAKLKPGISAAAGQADLAEVVGRLESEWPADYEEAGVVVRTFRQQIPGTADRQLFSFVQAAGLFVLLIACANIANLLLARGQIRQRELAVRSALGAGRARILRQLITENVVLGLVGGLAGTVLALAGVRFLRMALAGGLPSSILPTVDVWVLGFSLGISMMAGLVFGLVPSFHALRGKMQDALREGGARGAVGSRRRWSTAFVVAEVSLSLALLCGAGMLLHTFLDVQFGNNGFETQGLAGFSLTLPGDQYPDDASRVRAERQLVESLQALPGIAAASSTTALPRGRNVPMATVETEEMDLGAANLPRVSWLSVSPNYSEALGVTLLRGRHITWADNEAAPKVALVDQAFVQRFFPETDPLGQRIQLRNAERTIVGVLSDVRHRRIGVIDGPSATVYVPFAQNPTSTISFLVRSDGNVETAFDTVRSAVWGVDSDLPVAGLMTLGDYIKVMMRGVDVFSGIVLGFALFAVVLAALGVYGVLAYSVAQRRQEIGVRMAMGAGRGSVLAMIVGQGLKLTVLGLLIGAPMVFGIQRLVAGMLGQLSQVPPMLIPAIVVGLVLVTLTASLLPARRASGVAPTVALRAE
ncbi:MAG: ABC transporter permease [Acidobacteriota bacterium]